MRGCRLGREGKVETPTFDAAGKSSVLPFVGSILAEIGQGRLPA